MPNQIVYLKCDRNVEVNVPKVYLRDMGNLWCQNTQITQMLRDLEVEDFTQEDQKRCVISVLKLIALMQQTCPDITVQSMGESDVLVEWVQQDSNRMRKIVPKILMVCLVSFFGTALAIMTYHNDVGINEVFDEIYRLIMNRQATQINPLKVSYSIGLGIGIVIFFNHVGGRRITKDPTPIEVALRNYEQDVDMTLIANAARQGIEKE